MSCQSAEAGINHERVCAKGARGLPGKTSGLPTIHDPAPRAHLKRKPRTRTETIDSIDWTAFLGRNDMVWTTLPGDWENGAYTGNGALGAIFWKNNKGALEFEVSRSDLYDHRRIENDFSILHSQCRLPNGQFLLGFPEHEPTGSLRLDLWNAEVMGSLTVVSIDWKFRTYTHAERNVIVIELIPDDPKALPPTLIWHSELSKTTRDPTNGTDSETIAYPPQELDVIDGVQVSIQSMPEDARYRTDGRGEGEYATAWAKADMDEGRIVYYISTEFSYPGAVAARTAVDNIKRALADGPDTLIAGHRNWWHSYYPKSFVSMPDGALESFYWVQIYKMGSASRAGGPLIDLMGPWYKKGVWPAAWWNLNIQLSYWPFYTSNHLDGAQPLNEYIWKNREMLGRNAAPYSEDSYAIGRAAGPSLESEVRNEVGNLPWAMHNLWLYYRCSMDDAFLRHKLFPLMKGSFNYIRHIAVEQPDGTISLPPTASPEYSSDVINCSYTMACLRWLAKTLIEADERLGAHDTIVETCRDVMNRLVPYEVDAATGIMVGKGMPFTRSHRHWSHLFMIHPFHEWNWSDCEYAPLMRQSLDNWALQTDAFAGYSWLGVASMYASAGDGDRALLLLHTFLRKSPLSNTMYSETAPVIETPLAAARTIQEMLLTSHGGIIRIFPGVPSAWSDVNFTNLRAEGAFLVSASRQNGATRWVTVESLGDEPLRICHSLQGKIKTSGTRNFQITVISPGLIAVDVRKGETLTLYAGRSPADAEFFSQPVKREGCFSPWGGEKSLQSPTGFRVGASSGNAKS